MFGIFMESLVIFKLYTGLKLLFVLTLVSFLYLLVTEKDKTIRQLFVYAPVLILVLFLFPVSRKLFVAMGLDGETYYRVLWTIPMGMITAYGAVRFTCRHRRIGLLVSMVLIILCGSSMSFIEKELLADKNPLYGRATGIYKMQEMGFYDAVRFFPDYSEKDKILTYAVLGGIPHYLIQFDPTLDLADNIKRNILTKGSVLYSEVDFLLHQELRETPIYNSIIEAVALGNIKLNDISQKSLVEDTAKTSVYLRNLIELGIVEREFSVDVGIKEKANVNRGTYRLTDNFFRFWYAFGFSNLSQLEDGDVDGVYEYIIEPALHEFASLSFEDVCREFVRERQKKNALPFRYVKMGRWTGKTTVRDKSVENGMRVAETEIDLLGIGRDAKEYLVGECKFKHSPFSYSEYLDTVAKLSPQKSNAQFYYALFSESGFDSRIEAEAKCTDTLSLYDLNAIVNYDRSHL